MRTIAASIAFASLVSFASIARAEPTVPNAPTITFLEPGDRQVIVHWSPPEDGGSVLIDYRVSTLDDDGACIAGPLETQCTVTGLFNGVPYRFHMKARNAIGNSAFSPLTEEITPRPPGWDASVPRPLDASVIAIDASADASATRDAMVVVMDASAIRDASVDATPHIDATTEVDAAETAQDGSASRDAYVAPAEKKRKGCGVAFANNRSDLDGFVTSLVFVSLLLRRRART